MNPKSRIGAPPSGSRHRVPRGMPGPLKDPVVAAPNRVLRFALSPTRCTATEIGYSGVVVDAKPEARESYLAYGFEPLSLVEGASLDRPEPTPMFLPLSAIPPPMGSVIVGRA